MHLDLIDQIYARAKAAHKHIVLPEGYDQRIMAAAAELTKREIAQITLLGNKDKLCGLAREWDISLDGVDLVDPADPKQYEEYAEQYYELRKNKGCSLERAHEVLQTPVPFGTMMLHNDRVDGMVAGAVTATADVLRPAFRIIRTDPQVKLASAYFLLVTPQTAYGEKGAVIVADGAVNPSLTSEQMADVAYTTAMSAKYQIGFEEPRVAMISFSTMGSAKHETVTKVTEAVRIAKEKYPELLVDGEMQLDAAIDPKVSALKAPNSPVAGRANILIFPDLTSGNNCYKAIQRFSGAEAIGPVLQGMAKPVNDLSRGCTTKEIVDTVAVVCCGQKNK